MNIYRLIAQFWAIVCCKFYSARLSLRPPVCPIRAGTVSKRLNIIIANMCELDVNRVNSLDSSLLALKISEIVLDHSEQGRRIMWGIKNYHSDPYL